MGGGGAAGMAERTGVRVDARICALCKTPFNPRAPRKILEEHVESKHAKSGFAAAFPDYKE